MSQEHTNGNSNSDSQSRSSTATVVVGSLTAVKVPVPDSDIHLAGAISCLNYAATSNHVPLIPYVVSLSSRFHMADVKRKHGPDTMALLEKQVVPVKDICEIQTHLSHARTAVRIITGADHNYKRHYNVVSETVAHYFTAQGRKEEWSRRILPNWKAWVHAVGGVLNFRTVGDIWIPSSEDGTVSYLRPGVIYRCADISKPTPEGIKVLEALNITDVFDLRSNSETERRGTFESDKIKRHHTPVFSEVDYSPAQIAVRFTMYMGGTEGFAKAYMSMLPNIQQFLPPILKHIVEKRTPFIVHCTAGKDRTGVVCALLQMVCGVDEEQIAWEYELTSRCMA
ncbi:hypothetical protein BGZ58_001830, partial [Dissophora ornata]